MIGIWISYCHQMRTFNGRDENLVLRVWVRYFQGLKFESAGTNNLSIESVYTELWFNFKWTSLVDGGIDPLRLISSIGNIKNKLTYIYMNLQDMLVFSSRHIVLSDIDVLNNSTQLFSTHENEIHTAQVGLTWILFLLFSYKLFYWLDHLGWYEKSDL